MTKPIVYSGSATFENAHADGFLNALDPQAWNVVVPEIWLESYLVTTPEQDDPGAPPATNAAPGDGPPDGGGDVTPPLLDERDKDPPGLNAQRRYGIDGRVQVGWENQLFFEEVVLTGFKYRNVLKTSFKNDLKKNNSFRFDYTQYDCLDTKSEEPANGGVDVDHGFVECQGNPGDEVTIVETKTVRFTEPRFCVDEINAVSAVLIPFMFDSWLHGLVFNNS